MCVARSELGPAHAPTEHAGRRQSSAGAVNAADDGWRWLAATETGTSPWWSTSTWWPAAKHEAARWAASLGQLPSSGSSSTWRQPSLGPTVDDCGADGHSVRKQPVKQVRQHMRGLKAVKYICESYKQRLSRWVPPRTQFHHCAVRPLLGRHTLGAPHVLLPAIKFIIII